MTQWFSFKVKSMRITGALFEKMKKIQLTQKVIVNGHISLWTYVKAGVPHMLLFLIYVNNLVCNLLTHPKLFTDDMLLFSIVNDIHFSTNVLNDALSKK